MPSYDYKCGKCDNRVTIVAGIKEEIKLPICHSQEMTRIFTAPPITFKGNGFNSKKG